MLAGPPVLRTLPSLRPTTCSPAPFNNGSLKRTHSSAWRQVSKGSVQCRTASAQVVLTREKGKNAKLAKLLDQKQISWAEIPLIETIDGPDRSTLADMIRQGRHQWIVITSPEAASVFLQGWKQADCPQVRIAVVGEGTSQILKKEGQSDLLNIAFTPSKANAKHLSAELPLEEAETTVLYPASNKARPELQKGLETRGCHVTRLNTYDTVPVRDLSQEQIGQAKSADVVAIASPSAVEAWLELIGPQTEADLAVACIGSTSANAAEALGLKRVFSTDSPGLAGFVEAIESALASCQPASC